jgi:hypothetical protein
LGAAGNAGGHVCLMLPEPIGPLTAGLANE